jgi:high-affinity iron transporter
MFGMLNDMSSASFLIALREGFEGALIVAIVLAFVKRGPKPEMARAVWFGTAAAVAIAVGAGLIINHTVKDLHGDARRFTFAGVFLAAAALLTWMIFWMKKNARHLKKELEGRAGDAVLHDSGWALAMVAFLAVVREGLETALFLISASTSTNDSPAQVRIGILAGLAVAALLGVVVYRGAHHFDMRRFFQITGVLVITFAAGLVSRAIFTLQGNTVDVVYNVTGMHWLTGESQVGKFLTGIFGWDPAPSGIQFTGYWLYLVPALVFFFWERKRKTVPAGPASEPVVDLVAEPAPQRVDEPEPTSVR